MLPKNNKIIINKEQLDSLNHWRDQILKMEKSYYSQDLEKQRTCKNMINKYLDEVLDYNKNIKEKPKNKV
jgi:hypothetical protein